MSKLAIVKTTSMQRLIDDLGEVVEQRTHYENREKALKEVIRRHGAGAYRGRVFDAMLSPRTISSYKTELLKQHVDEKILSKCVVKTPYLKVELTRRTPLHAVK